MTYPIATHRVQHWFGQIANYGLVVTLVILSSFFASCSEFVAAQSPPPAAESLGITFVRLESPAKIAEVMKTHGSLVEMPYADLESKLERAAELVAPTHRSPRFIKATYRAELIGNSLSNGNAVWVIDNPGRGPAILSLPNFNLAISRSRLEGDDAIVGDLDGTNLGVWIPRTGTQTLVFDWSARGTPGVPGVSFDLRIPNCPIVVIELRLPADQALLLPKSGGLVTGPLETENSKFKLWRLQVAGRSQVDLLIRRGNEAGREPRLFSSIDTRAQLSLEHTLYDVDVQVEVLHSPVRELNFELDPALQPFEVTSRQTLLQGWKVETTNNRRVLKVNLREPLLGVLAGLRLRCTGPRWTEKEASIARVELIDAIARGETIKLFLQPDQHLERWDPGSFRLVNSSTESDGSQSLTLVDTRNDGKGPRPRFRVRTENTDFSTREDLKWRLDAGDMTLNADIHYDVQRGRLFGLDVRLPKDAEWQIVSVELSPREALQKWTVAAGILHVDLQQAITPRVDGRLSVVLRQSRNKSPATVRALDFPEVTPLGPLSRQGSLAIFADSHQPISLIQSNQPTARPPITLSKDPRLQYYFVHRQQTIQGKLKWTMPRPVLQAKVREQVLLTPEFGRVEATLTVEPIVGQPTSIDVFLTGKPGTHWQFESSGAELSSRERLPLVEASHLAMRLANNNPWSRLVNEVAAPRGEIWRLSFREPLAKSVSIVAKSEFTPSPFSDHSRWFPPILSIDHGLLLAAEAALRVADRQWSIPIIVPLDAERIDAELTIDPVGVTMSNIRTHGMDPASSPPAGSGFTRLFRLKNTHWLSMSTIQVQTQRRPTDESRQATLDVAELVTSIDATGNVSHTLRVRAWNWAERDFRIVLPSDAVVLSARLNQVEFDRVERAVTPEGLVVALPMLGESGPHVIELSYQGQAHNWLISAGRSFAAPMPRLPLEPLSSSRTLRLARDWLPLHQESLASLDERSPTQETFDSIWRAGRSWLQDVLPSVPPAWIEQQRLALLNAESDVGRAGIRQTRLADAIAGMIIEPRTKAVPLVLDYFAFRSLGLSWESTATFVPEGSTPFWERLGLAYVPTPDAALLTSKARAAKWSRGIREGSLSGRRIAQAVADAIQHGQDASGQFLSADSWLQKSVTPDLSPITGDSGDGAGSWQILFSESNPDSATGNDVPIIVVRKSRIPWLAVCLGLFVWGGLVACGRFLSPSSCFRLNWAILAGTLLVMAWLPMSIRELALGPIFAAGIFTIGAYRRLIRPSTSTTGQPRTSKSTQRVVRASLGGLMIAVAGTIHVSSAQGPVARVIYLIPNGNEQSKRALVPAPVARWLDDQEKRARVHLEDAVYLASRYQGRWADEGSVFRVEFDVWTARDRVPLTIPLIGVDLLEGSLLDGTPVFPIVAPGQRGGYQVEVASQGLHRLTLSFSVRRQVSGDVKFTGPSTVSSSVSFASPSRLGAPRIAKCLGDIVVRRDAKKGEFLLDAQVGREPTILIQGLAASTDSDVSPGMQVRELYAWDLRSSFRTLHALLAYSTAGDVTQIEVQLPKSLEVRSVEMAEPGNGRSAAAIKAWRVVPRDNGRVIQVEFLEPLTGSFPVIMNMVPRWSNTAGTFDLRLPLPLKATVIDGMMGVRVDEPDALEKAQSLGVAPVSPEEFVKEWGRLCQREVSMPLHAFTFARATKTAGATFDVTPLAAKPRVQVEYTWTALPRAIDLAARYTVASVDDQFLMSIDVDQSLSVRDVQGVDVHHWSRSGELLHVWLIGPRKKTTFQIDAGLSLPSTKAEMVKLPPPSILGAIVDAASLILASGGGLVLEPNNDLKATEEPAAGSTRRFRVLAASIPTDFHLRPAQSRPEYQTLTTVETVGDRCTVAIQVHGRIDHGDFPELQFRLVGSQASAPRLVVTTPGAKVRAIGSQKDQAWAISYPPRSPCQVHFSIQCPLALTPGSNATLPHVHLIRGGTITEKFFALSGVEFSGSPAIKTQLVRSTSKDLAPWPLELARLKATAAAYGKWTHLAQPPAVVRRESDIAPSARVLSTRHDIVAGHASRWLHRMTWTVFNKSAHDLDVLLPGGASFKSAWVDGSPSPHRQSGPETLSIPLTGGLRPRQVIVCWTYPSLKESIAQPRLAAASLIALDSPPVVGTLGVPAGWALTDPKWGLPLADAAVDQVLAQTQSFAILAEELANVGKGGQPALIDSLHAFAAAVRQAEYRFDLKESELPPTVSESIRQRSALAKKIGLNNARTAADAMPWPTPADPLSPGDYWGVPIRWRADHSEMPRIELQPAAGQQPRLSLLPIALLVFVLSFWPIALKCWVSLWPEQLAALSLVGFSLAGFSLIGAGVFLIAILARSLIITGRVRRLVRRWWKKTSLPASSFASPRS